MSEVTVLLSAGPDGGPVEFDRLYELLYQELHQLAHARIRRSGELTLLDTTALVHEAYLRFEHHEALSFSNRGQFMAYAARVMRAVVIDTVRRRQAERHGGGHEHVQLEETHVSTEAERADLELLRMHDSLEALAAIDERLVRVVEMRYFAGMTETEIAMALGVAVRTVGRDWEKARLFLHSAMR